jgi:hypothetical protein
LLIKSSFFNNYDERNSNRSRQMLQFIYDTRQIEFTMTLSSLHKITFLRFFFLYLTNTTKLFLQIRHRNLIQNLNLLNFRPHTIAHAGNCGQQLSVKRQNYVIICAHLGSAVFPALR